MRRYGDLNGWVNGVGKEKELEEVFGLKEQGLRDEDVKNIGICIISREAGKEISKGIEGIKDLRNRYKGRI